MKILGIYHQTIGQELNANKSRIYFPRNCSFHIKIFDFFGVYEEFFSFKGLGVSISFRDLAASY